MKKLDKKNIEEILPLTPMQEGMLFHYLQEPKSEQYFEQLSLQISGSIDTRLFEKAWNTVIAANEMLRTLLRWEKLEKPTQVILKKYTCKVALHDLSNGDHGPNRTLLQDLKDKDRHNPFDLRQVPFRIMLCKLDEDNYEMILSNHHIIYDGWSSGIILKEFFEAYQTLCGGGDVVPRRKPPFKNFVKWIRKQDKAKLENFWDTYLKDFGTPVTETLDAKRKQVIDTANHTIKFPPQIKAKLDALVKGLNITIASFLYGAWGILLQDYNQSSDVVFHTTTAGRSAKIKGIEDMVGLFINTLPLRVKTQPGARADHKTVETVEAFLSRMHQELNQWSAYENSSPLTARETLAKYNNETFFDSVLVIENYPLDRLSEKETAPLSIRSFSISETTNYDLTVIITLFDRIEFNITYNKNLFTAPDVSNLFGHLRTVIEEMVNKPCKTLREIEGLPAEARDNLRRHIHAAREAAPSAECDYAAPRNRVEEQLVDIWSDVLNISADKIGIDHNFFDFGGHSLKASLLTSRIHRVLAVKIPLAEVFHRPCVRELAKYISTAAKEKYVPIPAVETKDHYTVSAAQKRLYMLHRLNPESLAYNGPWVVKLEGSLDEGRLLWAFKRLIERHEILHTSFGQKDGEPIQVIHPDVDFEIRRITAINDCIRPFDLAKAPLMRAGLMNPGEQVYFLVVDMHHIITDGTSTAVLTGELAGLYNGRDLPAPGVQYKDFCQWHLERLQRGELKKQEDYWLAHLAGELPVLDLPLDFPRPRSQSFAGERIGFQLTDELARQLYVLMKETGTTLYMVSMAVFNTFLSWYGGGGDIIVGTPIAGRNHGDLENTVGLFLETQAIRSRPEGGKTFGAFLKEVKHSALQANENRDYPFHRLMKKLSPMKDLSRNPLFDVMVNVLNQTGVDFELEGMDCTPCPGDWKVAKVDLTLEAIEEKGKIKFELEYCTALFRRDTAERIVSGFLNVLGQVVFNPGVFLGEIKIISEGEKRQLLDEFNNTAFQYDADKTVVQSFARQVEKKPDHIALFGPTQQAPAAEDIVTVTYRELNRRSDELARLIRVRGIISGSIAAIMVERSIEMILCIMGVLKAGGAYLPIDPDYPPDRIDYMLKDSAVGLLVGTGAPVKNLKRELNTLFIDTLQPSLPISHPTAVQPRDFPAPQPGDRAYVIYTSGSTGKPRGVVVKHRSLMAYIRSFRREFVVRETDIVLQQASFSFDVFVEEVYPCLLAGGALALPPRRVIRDAALLVDYIRTHHIDIIDCSPLLLNELNRRAREDESNPLKSIHTFISGGDMLKGEYVDHLLKTGSVYNTYGPTETTVCTSYHRVTGNEGPAVPIGKPIGNYRVYILDDYRRLLPLGAAGEICVGGVGVTGGYLNHPELTAAKFIPHLWSDEREERVYLTGDLGRWLPDGSIEFLGRKDRQVKIRGFRIEPGEIETQLLTHEDILEAIVTSDGSQAICAYFTAGKEKNVREMREFLSRSLPAYMIPAFFVQMPQMPLGPTGKIDVKALPKPAHAGLATGAEYEPPQSDLQEKLADMWQELLGRGNIGIMDDFFDLGGDSILVNRCVAMIREALNVEISLRTFFEQPHIKSLAREIRPQIDRQSGTPGRRVLSIPRAERTGPVPLSFPQERLWFLQNLDQENVAYFVPRVIRIMGNLEPRLLERTFSEIIRRHEILRTAFITRDGVPVQEVREPYYFKIPVIPLEPEEVEDWLNLESRKAFDFETGTLLRVTLLKHGDSEHLLVLTEHHLVHDGWTQGVLLKEFIAIFSAYTEGRDHDLPELPIQYADFALWQRDFLRGPCLEMHLDYWREKLGGVIPLLELPVDYPRPPVISGNGAMKERRLSGALSGQLEAFCRKNNVTLFMVMLAAFKILLYRYSGEEDLCVGTGIANRGYKEMEGMLGMVINTLPLRTHTVGDLTFTHYLKRVKATCLEAYQHQDTPFGKIVEALAPERSLGYNPLFQVMFSFMDTPTEDLWLPGLELRLEPLHNRSSKFDISIVVVPPPERSDGEILVEWEYNTDIFTDSTMEQMLGHYCRLIREILTALEEKISALPMLAKEELDRLLYEWNNMGIPYPREKTIHKLFTEQAEKKPDHIALIGPGAQNKRHAVSISYSELNTRSDKLARRLRESGVGPGTIAAIIVERSVEVIIGILAILKAGSAYLPIDPDYPLQRIHYMLKDSAAVALVGSCSLEEKIKKFGRLDANRQLDTIFIDYFQISQYSTSPYSSSQPSDPAYIIYTSGSTGIPKGVLVDHSSAVNLVSYQKGFFNINTCDRVMQFSSLCFDASVEQIFIALSSGASLILVDKNTLFDNYKFEALLARELITHLHAVPLFLNQLNLAGCCNLKRIVSGGDICPGELAKKWCNRYDFYNEYGPTETTVTSIEIMIQEIVETLPGLPIGMPIGNTGIYLLDKWMNLVPIGVTGEMYIGGAGVARGYLNRPTLTAEKFILPSASSFLFFRHKTTQKNLSNEEKWGGGKIYPPGVLYRTGDLARRLPDGNIEFLGRIDQQVKIRGMRIELGEIEVQLLKHRGIKEAVVVVTGDDGAAQNLAAYFVSEIEVSETELKDYLSKALPYYMIPSYFRRLEEIPLTPSGKIDRRALPAPGPKAFEGYMAPGNKTEEVLAGIWSELLGIENERIGINHSFFQLGGHSLSATIAVSRICRTFGVELSLGEFFRRPTIKELGNFLETLNKSIYDTVIPVEKRWYYPQSSAQKRLFFLDHFENIGTSYNMYAVLEVLGKPDEKQFEKTFKTLIARHEALRTSFHLVGKESVQRVHDTVDFEIEYYKYEKSKKVEEIIGGFVRPFDLSKAPLLRSGVCSLPGNEFLLFFDIHHIVSDGTSMSNLIDEFTRIYAGEQLSPLVLQYKDFSCWQNDLFQSGKIKRQEEYWLNIYPDSAEIPRLNLPTDYPRPAVMSFEGAHYKFEPVRSDLLRLEKLGARHGATLYMSLLSVFYILLYKYTGQNDIVVGSGIMGRRHDSLLNIIGMFVNVLANRNKPDGSKSCLEFLKEVKENSIQAFENQDVQFESLVDMLQIQRDTSRNPLFDVTFVVQNFKRSRLEIKDRTFIIGDYDNRSSKFDMTLFANQTGDEGNEISFTLEYSTVLFKRATIERFAAHFLNAIARVSNNPDLHLDDIDILSEEEKRLLLFQFNRSGDFYPLQKTVHQLYEERAAGKPDKTALIFGDRFLTYKQLDETANQIANLLTSTADAGSSIGLLMDRSPELIAAMLGTLKAGCSYVPLNPVFPEKRIKGILMDAAVRVFISQKRYVRLFNRLLWECPLLDAAICLDSRDIYLEEEEEKSGLMDNELWDYVAESAEDEITLGGWNTSYTGEPFTRKEMEEYGANIFKKLFPYLHETMRVLEIGCGSGFSMYPIASRVGFYCGTDLSKKIIDKNRERVNEENLENIALACVPAHEIDSIAEGNFDLIVMNSVIQSFHGHNYFRKVIEKVLEKLGKRGFMFIGDVMDLELKDALTKEMIEFKRATANENYKTKTDFSSELFLSRGFFEDLTVEFPEIRNVEFSGKIHTIENELTKFRYDAFITVDKCSRDTVKTGGKHKYLYDLTGLETCSTASVPVQVEPDHLAYVLYTSGSTGNPKGVMIEHRNVVSLVNKPAFIDLEETDRLLLTGSIAFDITTFEIWSPLLNGLSLVLIEENVLLDSERLENAITRNAISILHLIPQLFAQLASHRPGMFAGLKYFLVGGDLVQPKYVNMIRERYENLKILHMYGPTENTTFSTVFPVHRGYKTNIPIGKPIGSSKAYIINKKNKLQPLGVFGELCVSGEGIARGYLNDPGLTGRKFVSDPFVPGAEMYKTGDLGRWTLEGNIEFAGRMDRQVKIRGIRIELPEIEIRLLERHDIKEALVTAKEDGSGEFFLCAYIVPREGKPEISSLREFLSGELPEFMVPSYFVLLERFPTTPNGKIDKKRLPDPGTAVEKKEIEVPRNELDRELAAIWSDVLGIEERLVGIDTNFFEVGGHSLKATVLISKIHKELNIKIPVAEIFKRPTIRGLAGYIKEADKSKFSQIEPVEKREYYILSSAQKRIYIVQQMDLESTAYNMPLLLELKGEINKVKLENIFLELIHRHESLRTSFGQLDGEPVQRIHADVEFEIDYYETGVEDQPGTAFIKTYGRPFDLSQAPLLRAGILRLGGEGYYLVVDIHHIISDGISIELLSKEFIALNSGEELPPQRLQYKDYAQWQNRQIESGELKKQEIYWLNRFKDHIPFLDLPTDYPRTGALSLRGCVYFEIPAELTGKIRKFLSETGGTMFIFLLAVFFILLSRYSNREDIVVGCPIANRTHDDLNSIIGLFINMLAMRNLPASWKTFRQFLEEVKENSINAFDNQGYSFEELVSNLEIPRDITRNPLTDIIFGLRDQAPELEKLGVGENGGVGLNDEYLPNGIVRYDIELEAVETQEKVLLHFDYRSDLFKKGTMENKGRHLLEIVKNVITCPDIKISSIEMLDKQEMAGLKQMLITETNKNNTAQRKMEAEFGF